MFCNILFKITGYRGLVKGGRNIWMLLFCTDGFLGEIAWRCEFTSIGCPLSGKLFFTVSVDCFVLLHQQGCGMSSFGEYGTFSVVQLPRCSRHLGSWEVCQGASSCQVSRQTQVSVSLADNYYLAKYLMRVTLNLDISDVSNS